jgi:hypothetical protein
LTAHRAQNNLCATFIHPWNSVHFADNLNQSLEQEMFKGFSQPDGYMFRKALKSIDVAVQGNSMTNIRVLCVTLTIALVLVSSGLRADVTFLTEMNHSGRIGFTKIRIYAVNNSITLDDARKIELISQQTPQNTELLFRLDSSGGDVMVAITMG